MKILVSGASGMIGSALLPFLKAEGHELFRLVRTRANLAANEIAWDLKRGVISPELLEGLDAVIHLAGENIASGRWTEGKKQRILDSRAGGTHLISEALANLHNPPKVLISASAIGYYGDRGSEILTEQSHPGSGFLANLCEQWEAATQPAKEKGIRVVNPRIGVVLSSKGGVLAQLLTLFKLGLGGPLGSGEQYMSWIAIDDLLSIINKALKDESLYGPINAVSPNPVTNEEFTKTLGSVLHRPTFLRMPEFLLRILFGEVADALLLSSTRVIPQVLKVHDFQFAYPDLKRALSYLLS